MQPTANPSRQNIHSEIAMLRTGSGRSAARSRLAVHAGNPEGPRVPLTLPKPPGAHINNITTPNEWHIKAHPKFNIYIVSQ